MIKLDDFLSSFENRVGEKIHLVSEMVYVHSLLIAQTFIYRLC